jgi:hypothetical protein
MTDYGYGAMPDPFGYGNPNAANNPMNPTYGAPAAPASRGFSSYNPQPWEYSQGTVANPGPSAGYTAGQGIYGLQQGINQANLMAAPALAQSAYDRGRWGGDIQQALAYQGEQTGFLNADYDIGGRKIDLRQQGIDVDRTALGRQPGFLTTLHNIAGQGFDLTRAGQAAQAAQNRRGLEANLTGRGAFTSVGGQQGRYDIATDLVRQTQGTNLEQQGETARYFENMAQVGDQSKRLDIAASGLGLDREQLKNELNKGLSRLGLDTSTSISSLLDKIGSSNIQDVAMGQSIWNQALNSSDFFQRFYPGPNAAAGFGGPSAPADQFRNVR